MENQYDVIIIIGRGIHADGTLTQDSSNRVDKAVELFNQKLAPRILVSGLWSYRLEKIPARSEAAAMKTRAIELGIAKGDIVEELTSKDTVGNAYYTKMEFCAPNHWSNIILVTSTDHLERSKYIFQKVYGPSYNIRYETVEPSAQPTAADLKREQKSLSILKEQIDNLTDGDDKSLLHIMLTKHPAYAKDSSVSKEELIKMIEE